VRGNAARNANALRPVPSPGKCRGGKPERAETRPGFGPGTKGKMKTIQINHHGEGSSTTAMVAVDAIRENGWRGEMEGGVSVWAQTAEPLEIIEGWRHTLLPAGTTVYLGNDGTVLVPREQGGMWIRKTESVRPVAGLLRVSARRPSLDSLDICLVAAR